ncbi:hypothetical protein K432DRAFT_427219 [Lepidopterella palustris CBS 459.81]|uniref:Rhodopsin domain-containing protein n=1 Tax=Lepidopterella palustris CBS 459.81 TaxID=1314670 RepID=A0A8E2E6X4_9PEZI|nr:hypothetical protein K432DRAFT_427219 [Lepidopterella palustris CBS 459.81]
MVELFSRREATTDHNGTVVGIVSWVFLALTIISVSTRLVIKWTHFRGRRQIGLDDLVIVLATIFSIGQTAAVSVQVAQGLDQRLSSLNLTQLNDFQVTDYASNIMYIANLGTTRISVFLFIRQITPDPLQNKLAAGLGPLSLVWSVTSIFAASFQCSPSNTWKFLNNKCFNRTAFANYIGISNIILELIFILFPSIIIWKLRANKRGKLCATLCFSARLCVVVCIILQLFYRNRVSYDSDPTLNSWPVVLCAQLAQNLSIITACVPYLPSILNVLHSSTLHISGPIPSPTNRQTHYVAPLATYDFGQSDTNETDIFQRRWNVPDMESRPVISVTQPQAPRTISEIGILPAIETWETDSEKSLSESSLRRPVSEYNFAREKIISVPEGPALYEGRGAERFPDRREDKGLY